MVDVFDHRQVNLVLCGHNHMYERTHPLRGGRIVPPGQGTVYVTTGAGGAGLYVFRPAPPDYMAVWNAEQHGFTIIDVSDDLLHVRQVGEEKQYIDDFFVHRRVASPPASAVAG